MYNEKKYYELKQTMLYMLKCVDSKDLMSFWRDWYKDVAPLLEDSLSYDIPYTIVDITPEVRLILDRMNKERGL